MKCIDKRGLIIAQCDEVIGERVTASFDPPHVRAYTHYTIVANLGWTYTIETDDGRRFNLGAGKLALANYIRSA